MNNIAALRCFIVSTLLVGSTVGSASPFEGCFSSAKGGSAELRIVEDSKGYLVSLAEGKGWSVS